MKPANHNLYCYRGETYEQNVYFSQNGVPMDLSGANAKAQIREHEHDNAVVAEFDIAIVPAEGKITLSLNDAITSTLEPKYYVYDLKITSNSIVTYWLRGKFIVDGRVTV